MAEERLSAVSEAINFHLEKEPEPGFLTGLAGQALFLYQYGRTCGSDRHENQGFLALRRCLRILELGFTWPSYAAGIAGIRYALHYLADNRFITPAEGAALDDARPYLLKFAEERIQSGDYDLLHGALGILLSLGPEPPRTLTTRLSRSLQELAIAPAEGQLAWTSVNPKSGTPEINLGLAHGVPSILLMLSRMNRPKGSALNRVIEQGMNFLLSCEMHPDPSGSLFPHRLIAGLPDQPGRLAWCYGDPGVGAAVWQIGANCGRDDWKAEGVRILRSAATRKHAKSNRIYDACLCHGSAGLALIFYKMALLTGHEELLDASDHWMRATLDYGHEEHHAGGYRYLTTGDRYLSNYSLLEGLAGTGLAILTLLEPDQNLGWEQALLL